MKSDVEKSIKIVRKKLKQTIYDDKKIALRNELKKLKNDLLKEQAS